eukprot:1971886-Rhodomonas_salina.1
MPGTELGYGDRDGQGPGVRCGRGGGWPSARQPVSARPPCPLESTDSGHVSLCQSVCVAKSLVELLCVWSRVS